MLMLAIALLAQDPVGDAVRLLESGDIEERQKAEMQLALLGDAAADRLAPLMESEDPELSARARRSFEKNRRHRRLPPTLAIRIPSVLDRDLTVMELLALPLSDAEGAFFARQAVRVLTLRPSTWYRLSRGKASPADLLDAARRAPSPTLRAYALSALQEADPASAVCVAVEALRSSSPEVKIQALFTLAETGTLAAAAEMKRLIRDPNAAISEAAELSLLKLIPGADIRRRDLKAPASPRAGQLSMYAAVLDRGLPGEFKWAAPPPGELLWTDALKTIQACLEQGVTAEVNEGRLVLKRSSR